MFIFLSSFLYQDAAYTSPVTFSITCSASQSMPSGGSGAKRQSVACAVSRIGRHLSQMVKADNFRLSSCAGPPHPRTPALGSCAIPGNPRGAGCAVPDDHRCVRLALLIEVLSSQTQALADGGRESEQARHKTLTIPKKTFRPCSTAEDRSTP